MSIELNFTSNLQPASGKVPSESESICDSRRAVWSHSKTSTGTRVFSSANNKLWYKIFELCYNWTRKFTLDGYHSWDFLYPVSHLSHHFQPHFHSLPEKGYRGKDSIFGSRSAYHMLFLRSNNVHHFSRTYYKMEKTKETESCSPPKTRQSLGNKSNRSKG